MYSHLPARKASVKPHFLTKITYFGGKRESYFFTYDMNPVEDSQAHNPRLKEKGQLFYWGGEILVNYTTHKLSLSHKFDHVLQSIHH